MDDQILAIYKKAEENHVEVVIKFITNTVVPYIDLEDRMGKFKVNKMISIKEIEKLETDAVLIAMDAAINELHNKISEIAYI